MSAFRLSALGLVAGLMLLPGCAALSALQGEPDRDVFELRAPSGPVNCPRARISELVVELPKSRGTLDSDRIMIRPARLQTQYLPDAQWGDTVPVTLQRLLVQNLGGTGSFAQVGRTPLGSSGDYAMLSEIEDFNAEITDEGVMIRLAVDARLVSEMTANIVSRQRFAVAVPAAGTRTDQLIPAFDAATRQLVGQVTAWALSASGVNPARCG